MAQLEPDALRGVERALARYIAEVEGAGLKPSTAHTYIHHARAFVRWLKGGFAPGATLPRDGTRGAPPLPPAWGAGARDTGEDTRPQPPGA